MLGLVALGVLLAAVGTANARTVAGGVSARRDPSAVGPRGDGWQRCNDTVAARSGDNTSVGREKALLKDLIGKGWKPTKAGKDLLAGKLPDSVPLVADDGTAMGDEVSAQLAQLPQNAPQARKLQGAKRSLSSTAVFLDCGIGQKANVNFSVIGLGTYTSAWVVWNLVNVNTGASKNVRSAGTNYCPGGTLCLEYFYLKPASPWYVFIATEYASYPAPPPAPISAYCGG